MILISDLEATQRIIQHARNHNYKINTEDFAAKNIESNILAMTNQTNKTNDHWAIHAKFSGTTYILSEGRLLEILLDLDLLGEDEQLDIVNGVNNLMAHRSNIIREPWNRAL